MNKALAHDARRLVVGRAKFAEEVKRKRDKAKAATHLIVEEYYNEMVRDGRLGPNGGLG